MTGVVKREGFKRLRAVLAREKPSERDGKESKEEKCDSSGTRSVTAVVKEGSVTPVVERSLVGKS